VTTLNEYDAMLADRERLSCARRALEKAWKSVDTVIGRGCLSDEKIRSTLARAVQDAQFAISHIEPLASAANRCSTTTKGACK
jgi:hypothetical protein